eukprot:188739-Chlamydomonas_euryale.AAC.1
MSRRPQLGWVRHLGLECGKVPRRPQLGWVRHLMGASAWGVARQRRRRPMALRTPQNEWRTSRAPCEV